MAPKPRFGGDAGLALAAAGARLAWLGIPENPKPNRNRIGATPFSTVWPWCMSR
jgi:hypothetical protein